MGSAALQRPFPAVNVLVQLWVMVRVSSESCSACHVTSPNAASSGSLLWAAPSVDCSQSQGSQHKAKSSNRAEVKCRHLWLPSHFSAFLHDPRPFWGVSALSPAVSCGSAVPLSQHRDAKTITVSSGARGHLGIKAIKNPYVCAFVLWLIQSFRFGLWSYSRNWNSSH